MGREVRKVPPTWQHPKDDRGRYQPLYDEDFNTAARTWLDNVIAWDNGTHADVVDDPTTKERYPFFWQWEGSAPDEKYYRPTWTDEERTHFMMYETTSEGTPISPPMESPEALARWLADNGASANGGQTASYQAWLRVCLGGWAPSMIGIGGKLMSGVEGLARIADASREGSGSCG